MDNHEHGPVRVRQRHGPMASSELVAELVARYEGRRPPRMVHGATDGEHPPTMGLDLDELHPAGEPIPVEAALREVDGPPPELPVWVTLRPAPDPDGSAAGAGRVDVRLGWDSATGSFRGELPGQPAGLYAVQVVTQAVPGGGDLTAEDTIAVLPDEEPAGE
jgi:hypothetical protein